MKQTKPIQQIVDFMNERPDKLFGGKYKKFYWRPFKLAFRNISVVIEPIGDNPADEIPFDFDSTYFLRELAKAKWGDEGFNDDFADALYPFKRDYFLKEWVLIESEQERTRQIAKDILEK